MTTTSINPATTIGELVRQRPARSRIFERLNLDYCCGGKLPLEEACAKRGLDVRNVLQRLAESDDADSRDDGLVDPDAMGLAELADHIEQTHHAYLKQELPRLGTLVRKVAAVHGEHYPWMLEIDGVFAGFAAELESHMMKEEQILFPLIRHLDKGGERPAAGPPSVSAPIRVMEHEHDDAGRALARMSELSGGFTPPQGACNTFRAMLDGLAHLEQDMHQHVHKENNVLFPKAAELEAELTRSGDA